MEFLRRLWKTRAFLFLSLPAVILFLLFSYLPMFGVVLAFKRFDFTRGVFGSPWCGFENFRILLTASSTMWRILRNTIGYYLLFTIVGTPLTVLLAIAINEFAFKRAGKTFQSFMILPTFISYVAVSYIVKGFLEPTNGFVNRMLANFGAARINWYSEARYWPVILLLVNVWKGCGYGSVLYLSALSGIDQELYEAADLDGASKLQRMTHITIPLLIPMISIMVLLGLGGIMHSNTGLFYQVTLNSGMLYPTTQVLDSYILNSVLGGTEFGMTSAVALFQSVVGCLMVVGTNLVVRRFAPENALF